LGGAPSRPLVWKLELTGRSTSSRGEIDGVGRSMLRNSARSRKVGGRSKHLQNYMQCKSAVSVAPYRSIIHVSAGNAKVDARPDRPCS
jgi:hypothetical protein